jgi:prepilin signal peptidase PulO-like enzyme (type II secretory pathway)
VLEVLKHTATTPRRRAGLVAAALSALVVMLSFPPAIGAGIAAAILLLARAAETDQATHRIPNRLLMAAALALLAAATATGTAALIASGVIAAAWLTTLLAVHTADPRLAFGDVKLGGVLGTMIGLACHAAGWDAPHAALASSAAFVLGAALTLVAHRDRDRPAPFAPGLVIAAVTITVTLGLAT